MDACQNASSTVCIDGLTAIPEELYVALLRAGQLAKQRGQHRCLHEKRRLILYVPHRQSSKRRTLTAGAPYTANSRMPYLATAQAARKTSAPAALARAQETQSLKSEKDALLQEIRRLTEELHSQTESFQESEPDALARSMPPSFGPVTLWAYRPFNGLPISIRSQPTVCTSKSTGVLLQPETVFAVDRELAVEDRLFLCLADGRGWVFDRASSGGILCVRQAAERPDAAAEPCNPFADDVVRIEAAEHPCNPFADASRMEAVEQPCNPFADNASEVEQPCNPFADAAVPRSQGESSASPQMKPQQQSMQTASTAASSTSNIEDSALGSSQAALMDPSRAAAVAPGQQLMCKALMNSSAADTSAGDSFASVPSSWNSYEASPTWAPRRWACTTMGRCVAGCTVLSCGILSFKHRGSFSDGDSAALAEELV